MTIHRLIIEVNDNPNADDYIIEIDGSKETLTIYDKAPPEDWKEQMENLRKENKELKDKIESLTNMISLLQNQLNKAPIQLEKYNYTKPIILK
jgi:hypothetical protein